VFATMRDTKKASALRIGAGSERLEVEIASLDVTDDRSVEGAVSEILERAGGMDVLANNAGVGARAAVETFSDGVVHSVFEANVFGGLRMLRSVLPGSGSGSGAGARSSTSRRPPVWRRCRSMPCTRLRSTRLRAAGRCGEGSRPVPASSQMLDQFAVTGICAGGRPMTMAISLWSESAIDLGSPVVGRPLT
jgi:NAD(P)-dependent dehydrogenase (short-subunit alcohol dehydrogenase family)